MGTRAECLAKWSLLLDDIVTFHYWSVVVTWTNLGVPPFENIACFMSQPFWAKNKYFWVTMPKFPYCRVLSVTAVNALQVWDRLVRPDLNSLMKLNILLKSSHSSDHFVTQMLGIGNILYTTFPGHLFLLMAANSKTILGLKDSGRYQLKACRRS